MNEGGSGRANNASPGQQCFGYPAITFFVELGRTAPPGSLVEKTSGWELPALTFMLGQPEPTFVVEAPTFVVG